ncbi:AAA family ATPase, partial [candidate division KSB3 bacterium]|nr:AAA family ATPase [candidate division KSB3 bacterium]MBD3327635.1 AAA family ATPase [candidate division KSB3 bacterium]
PERIEFAELIQQIRRDLRRQMPVKIDLSHQAMHRLLDNLQGLTLIEAKKILTKAMIEDGKLAPDDIRLVIDAKKTIIEREGVLEYYAAEEDLEDIADLHGLKTWLAKRKAIITQPHQAAKLGLTFPKGILLTGIPGTGKSLCAKAVAMEWELPLLKMDPASLYTKYMGESEQNFTRAMAAAEKVAPVVLWIDEIEKAFATGDADFDGGTSQRILGTFLSWMQERQGDVFVVATSNDVTQLPPELLRKGRFDELFFVDLPDEEARKAIFEIHLTRRGHTFPQRELWQLAEAADGFSGAEIDQAIVSALYTAFAEGTEITTDLLLKEIQATHPLSETRAEDIQELRQWAADRAVSAQYVDEGPESASSLTRSEYIQLLKRIHHNLSQRTPIKVEMSQGDLNRLINNLRGLTVTEAKKILTKAMIRDGRLATDDIQFVIQAKHAAVEPGDILEYCAVQETLNDLAGVSRLKEWLVKRKAIILKPDKAAEAGLPFPKGLLLLGVPGTGKSLCAKAVAMEWGLPLLKLDPARVYDKYIGETEKNVGRAMQTAEKMAPAILWIDEIEKIFSSGGGEDSGVSHRVLGMFLSWMQDRHGDVFVVATSNDVTRLPPELLRKGRFDELFFLDLPEADVRAAIVEIHLKRRGHAPQRFDVRQIATVTDGFSGAEIEQVIVAALYTAFAQETSLTTTLILEEAHRTRPLSKTRAEHIQALRQWAAGRTARAQ